MVRFQINNVGRVDRSSCWPAFGGMKRIETSRIIPRMQETAQGGRKCKESVVGKKIKDKTELWWDSATKMGRKKATERLVHAVEAFRWKWEIFGRVSARELCVQIGVFNGISV